MLRARGIETLILTGIATSGVVLSTLRHAADADYRLLVVGDCCPKPLLEVATNPVHGERFRAHPST